MCGAFSFAWWAIGISSIVGWEIGGYIYRRWFRSPVAVGQPQDSAS